MRIEHLVCRPTVIPGGQNLASDRFSRPLLSPCMLHLPHYHLCIVWQAVHVYWLTNNLLTIGQVR